MTTQAIKARQDLVKTFSIDYVSAQDDMRYTGNFTIKKLTIFAIGSLGVRKAQLNGGMHYSDDHPGRGVDEGTDDFNNMIAHLELSIQAHPPWWNLDQITDVGLLGAIFKEVIAFEQTFLSRKADRAKSGNSGETGSATSLSEADAAGSTGPVVDKEVHAALEP